MKTDEKLMEKIRKLFALGNDNPNEEEANVALDKARELMEENDLSEEEIFASMNEAEISESVEDHEYSDNIAKFSQILLNAAMTLLDCRMYNEPYWKGKSKRRKQKIVGFPSNLAIAVALHHELDTIARACSCAKFKNRPSLQDDYRMGFAYKVLDRCQAIAAAKKNAAAQTSTAIVLVKSNAVENYFNSLGTKMPRARTSYYNSHAYGAGMDDGSKVDLGYEKNITSETKKLS